MTGSAKIRAKAKARRPAIAPARTPRRMSFFSMRGDPGRSVAGEAEEVPRVVHELVDDHGLAEHRRRALVHADEVVHRDREERGAEQPEQALGNRQGDGFGGSPRGGKNGHLRILLRGSCVPSVPLSGAMPEDLTHKRRLLTVARPCRTLTGFLGIIAQLNSNLLIHECASGVSCRRDSRRGAAPSGSAAGWPDGGPRRASCRDTARSSRTGPAAGPASGPRSAVRARPGGR